MDEKIIQKLLERWLRAAPLKELQYFAAGHMNALVALSPLFKKPISQDLIATLFEKIVNTAYMKPARIAQLIHWFAFFKTSYRILDPHFKTFLHHITLRLDQYPLSLQEQIKKNLEALSDCPAWKQALEIQLRISEEPALPAVIPFPTAISRHVFKPAIILSGRTLSRTEIENASFEKPAKKPRSAPLDAATKGYIAAYQMDALFKIIADKNLPALQRLLQITARSQHNNTKHSHRRPWQGRTHAAPELVIVHDDEHANRLATQLLVNTEVTALRSLIQQSEAIYFDTLLRACSKHVRFGLAKTQHLHNIMLYLPVAELPQMVGYFQQLELYRDSQALIQLVDALKLRILQDAAIISEHNRKQIKELILSLLNRGIEFHQGLVAAASTWHPHVLGALNKLRDDIQHQAWSPCIAEEDLEDELEFQAHWNDFENPRVDDGFISPPDFDRRPPSSKTAAVFLSQGGQQVRDANYFYRVEEIQTLLQKRVVENIRNTTLLASADMSSDARGNRVKDVLQSHLEHLIGQGASATVNQILIIPIHTHYHWVGITLDLECKDKPKIIYYNSSKNPETDQAKMIEILKDIGKISKEFSKDFGYLRNAVITSAEERFCLQQHDGSSCGAFLIENIRAQLSKTTECWPEGASSIRKLHQSLLNEQTEQERHLMLCH